MTVPDAAGAIAAAPAVAAHPVLIGAFFAALGAASYQEVRWRSALNALTLAMAAMAAAHLAVAYGAVWGGGDAGQLAPPAMLSGVAAAMLGLLRLAGLYGTADWAILSSLFAVLIPAGLHLAVLSVLAAVSSSCIHVVAVCAVSNARGRIKRGRSAGRGAGGAAAAGCGDDRIGGGWLGAAAAFVSSKRRSARDRWAYAPQQQRHLPPAEEGGPADAGGRGGKGGRGGGRAPAAWRGPRGGSLLGPGSRYAGRISPSVPVLAHSCAASAALLAVVGP